MLTFQSHYYGIFVFTVLICRIFNIKNCEYHNSEVLLWKLNNYGKPLHVWWINVLKNRRVLEILETQFWIPDTFARRHFCCFQMAHVCTQWGGEFKPWVTPLFKTKHATFQTLLSILYMFWWYSTRTISFSNTKIYRLSTQIQVIIRFLI